MIPDSINADNTPLEFPCRYPVKALVRHAPSARQEVLAVVGAHVEFCPQSDVRSRLSSNQRYQSITVTVTASSRQMLERIYAELRRLDAVVMTL